jgi:hypothetical protein
MATTRTITVAPSGGDATTLAAGFAYAVSTYGADLVSQDEIWNIVIDGTWSSADTTGVSITGVTTGASNYIYIYTTDDARHSGVWTDNAYKLSVTNRSFGAIIIGEDYVRIAGLQIENTSPTAANKHLFYLESQTADACDIRISDCIGKGHNDATHFQYGIYPASTLGTGKVYLWNNTFYNFSTVALSYPVSTLGMNGVWYVYSSTHIGGQAGIRRDTNGTVTAKNCYCGGQAWACYLGTITKTTCASSDTTGSTGMQSIAVSTDNFRNVTAGSEDYHITATSALRNIGTDTSAESDPLGFSTDIDGETRG